MARKKHGEEGDDALRLEMIKLAKQYGGYGYRKIAELLRMAGWRDKNKDASIIRLRPLYRNHIWSIDPRNIHSNQWRSNCLIHDKISNGRPYKMLTVMDEYTRHALAVHVVIKLGAAEVLEAMYPLIIQHGKPEHIRSDNGPEFMSEMFQTWLKRVGIEPIHIYPGSSWGNG